MKHYVVVLDWARKGENGVIIVGVGDTYEEAKEKFDKKLIAEREYASQLGWAIETDSNDMFDAGEMGYWFEDHITLYIQEVM